MNENQSDLPTLDDSHGKPAGPLRAPHIEGYRILDCLGEGGMGVVWRAVELTGGREVALKLIRAGAFATQRARVRFELEIEVCRYLDHPHIARVYDSGMHEGVPYCTMELIEGIPLDEYAKEHHLTGHRYSQLSFLKLMYLICDAVGYAHEQGVIHRDLKPSNILITPDAQPHLLDFGLAKAFGGAWLNVLGSQSGDPLGTPAFMSPEQASGMGNQIDVRTDVFTVGVIMYRMLTNQHPHDLSGPQYAVLRRIAEQPVRRPRSVAPQLVDRRLEAVLLKAMALDRDQRYANGLELAADLENYIQGLRLDAPIPTFLDTLMNFFRRG